MLAALVMLAVASFLIGRVHAGSVELGDMVSPRLIYTMNFTAAGSSTPVTVRNTYSKFTMFTSNNGAAAAAQTIFLQVAPPVVSTATPTFQNAVSVAGTSNGKTDTGTTPWTGAIVRVNAVLTPGNTPTPGATPGPTPESVDVIVIGSN